MAVYKVPQDVEADDKLIGPFSFRQFIYLIVVALAIALAWGLYQLFPLLVVIPLPVILLFGALALPLRKDQPMEIYLAAMISFYLKPRRRLWDADGIESLIEITVPKTVEVQRTKNLSQGEAQERFGYLAELVDSQGWAVRGQGVQAPDSAINSDVYFEAQQTPDVLDTNTAVSQSLDFMIGQSDAKRHQDMIDRMHQPAAAQTATQPTPAPQTYNFFTSQQPTPEPYVVKVQTQTDQAPIISPQSQQAPPTPQPQQSSLQAPPPTPQPIMPTIAPVTTSAKPIPAGIINLANNADLSIETIAREANRINQQQDMQDEVVIKLR